MSIDLKGNGKNEFTFIEEQIIPKKKSKTKKLVVMLSSTIGLAVVFGLVARYTFIVSEPYMKKLLGINENKMNVGELPYNNPDLLEQDGDEGEEVSQNEFMEENKNLVSSNATGNGGMEYPPDGGIGANSVGPEGDSETKVNNYYIREQIEATASDYVKMYSDMKRIAMDASSAVVTLTCITSGVDWLNNPYEASFEVSGLIVKKIENELMILVNWARIKDSKSIEATLGTSYKVEAKLYTYDEEINLAMLSIPLEEIPSHVLDQITVSTFGETYSVATGTPIIAIGNPNGYMGSLEMGMITSKSGVVYITDNMLELFTTDLLEHENGDGFIINLTGQVIGVITHTLKENPDENICTAIGMTRLKTLIDKMVTGTPRIYFGVKVSDMPTKALSVANVENGIYVDDVETNSPAYEAGIQSGDIIVALNEQPIGGVSSFVSVVANSEPKDTVLVKIRRMVNDNGKDLELNLTLSQR